MLPSMGAFAWGSYGYKSKFTLEQVKKTHNARLREQPSNKRSNMKLIVKFIQGLTCYMLIP